MIEATRAEALARLEAFVPSAGRAYRATRNEDRGPGDRSNVSVLAPYIRARLVTEVEVVRAVLARHSLSGAEKFVQEVFWRTYWKGWLESRPLVWQHYRRDVDASLDRVSHDRELSDAYARATEGRTDMPAFNAWAHELVEHGYLHNHARMWFASIWIFTLRLPWELGADFFMRHLLCGDPAANTLSWRWVAGLHTPGKTYRARRENILRYTGGRLDPGPHLAPRADALSGPTYAAGSLPEGLTLGATGPALLLLHDDDVGLETLPLEPYDIVTSCGLLAAEGRSSQPLAAGALSFAHGAIADALRRAPSAHEATIVSARDPVSAADGLVARARERDVRLVVTPYAPSGPVADALAVLEPLLAARTVTLVRILRPFDALAWPHATRGFFQLKSKIPGILLALGIGDAA
jgi:deoxyribodipyrimidine photo-lyase